MDQSEKTEYLSKLRNYRSPDGLSGRARAGVTVENLRSGKDRLTPTDKRRIDELDGLLAAAVLGQLVTDDEMTLGMVKPRANEGMGLPDDDNAAAQAIITGIGVKNVCLLFHTLMDRAQAENFYGKGTLMRLEQISTETPGISVAESHLRFITSGPISVMLISRPEGDTTGWWREKMGATRPSRAHPDSIRGKHATDKMMPNNLVHGSANSQEATAEIAAFQSIVEDLIKLGGAAL